MRSKVSMILEYDTEEMQFAVPHAYPNYVKMRKKEKASAEDAGT
jgi:hypothetical protein